MRCRGIIDNDYLRDVHAEQGGQGRSYLPRRACLFGTVINEVRPHPGSRGTRTLVATHL